jgi:cytochrome c oxidase subunit II
MQLLALQITALLLLALGACFIWVLNRTQGAVPIGQVNKPAYRLRSRLFLATLILGLVVTFATLTPWPHNAGAAEVTRHIDVKGRQWVWELSDDKARVGEVIEFRVTSEDVNHGFALYDEQRKIVAQIQAMPGFTNKVRYRFEHPGKYEILCMEYCGLAHHGMVAEFNVESAVVNQQTQGK